MDDFLYVNDKPVEETYISKDKSAYLATVSPGNFFTDDFQLEHWLIISKLKSRRGSTLYWTIIVVILKIVVSLVLLKKTKSRELSLSECTLYLASVLLMWINISIPLKKAETYQSLILVVLVLANAIVEEIKAYYEKESKV